MSQIHILLLVRLSTVTDAGQVYAKSEIMVTASGRHKNEQATTLPPTPYLRCFVVELVVFGANQSVTYQSRDFPFSRLFHRSCVVVKLVTLGPLSKLPGLHI